MAGKGRLSALMARKAKGQAFAKAAPPSGMPGMSPMMGNQRPPMPGMAKGSKEEKAEGDTRKDTPAEDKSEKGKGPGRLSAFMKGKK